jgi:hypothetical protein
MQAPISGPTTGGRIVGPSHLVVLQIALALVLVLVGSLLARDFVRHFTFDPGFRTRGILSAEIALDPGRYPFDAATTYFSSLMEGAASLPGVTRAALVNVLPGTENLVVTKIQVDHGPWEFTDVSVVSADYLSVVSVRLVAGRAFTPLDGAKTPKVVVVNEAFAKGHWNVTQEALGRQISLGVNAPPWTVVGVSADARDMGASPVIRPRMHMLFTQAPPSPQMTRSCYRPTWRMLTHWPSPWSDSFERWILTNPSTMCSRSTTSSPPNWGANV